MKKLILMLVLLCSCHEKWEVDQAYEKGCNDCSGRCNAQRDRKEFQMKCDDQCKPAPGVADTAANEQKAWRCGCMPAEKR